MSDSFEAERSVDRRDTLATGRFINKLQQQQVWSGLIWFKSTDLNHWFKSIKPWFKILNRTKKIMIWIKNCDFNWFELLFNYLSYVYLYALSENTSCLLFWLIIHIIYNFLNVYYRYVYIFHVPKSSIYGRKFFSIVWIWGAEMVGWAYSQRHVRKFQLETVCDIAVYTF